MDISQAGAAAALKDIAVTSARSQELYLYQKASPVVMLWGALWIIAGAVTAIAPDRSAVAWLTIAAIGTAATIYHRARRDGDESDDGRARRRYYTVLAISVGFVAATPVIFAPVAGIQMVAFVALLTGAVYMCISAWIGLRYFIVGAALAITAGVSFIFLQGIAQPLTAGIGGLALVVGGRWMRSV